MFPSPALFVLSLAFYGPTPAAGPGTRTAAPPADIRPAPLVGQAVDPTRPAFVPKFAKVNNPPAGNFAERSYAYFYTYPTPLIYGYGGYGFAYYGYRGPASWGSTQVPFR